MSAYQQLVESMSPVGYWRLRDDDLDATVDAVVGPSGTRVGGVHQQADGPIIASPRLSSYFDGAGDHITVPNISAIDGSSELSISAWINLDTLGSNNADDGGIFCSGADTPETDRLIFWYNHTGVGTLKSYSFAVGGSDDANRLDGPVDAALAGTWQHVLATMSGTSRKMYLDGDLVASKTAPTSTVPSTGLGYRIGSWVANPIFDHAGGLTEVAVWDRELTADDVAALYAGQLATPRNFIGIQNIEAGVIA